MCVRQIVRRQIRDGREVVLQLPVTKNPLASLPDCSNRDHESRSQSEPVATSTVAMIHIWRHGWTREPGQVVLADASTMP